MINLVLFGPPGAGKGTQSKKLCDKYKLIHLSTGDLLRDEISRGTVLGIQARQVMDRGELVSDEIVVAMIGAKLDANPHVKGFIFDGFPRTQAQAKALDDLLHSKKNSITMMIALEVNDEELMKRLLLRGEESGRPDDRNEEVIRRRIYEYNSKTAPLKQYYAQQGKFHSVYGMGSVDDIFDLLCATIDNKTRPKEPFHDGTVTVADISVEDEPAMHMKDMPAKKMSPKKPGKKVVKKAPAKRKQASKPTKKAAKKKKTAKPAPKKKAAKKVVKKNAPKKAVKKAPAKKPIAKKKVTKKLVKKAKPIAKKKTLAKKKRR